MRIVFSIIEIILSVVVITAILFQKERTKNKADNVLSEVDIFLNRTTKITATLLVLILIVHNIFGSYIM